MISANGILFIEPSENASPEPIIDELTRLMTGAMRHVIAKGILGEDGNFYPGVGARGFHICTCGVRSTNCDYQLVNGHVTNSLAIHYLAYHRSEIDTVELDKVRALQDLVTPTQPTEDELQSPQG